MTEQQCPKCGAEFDQWMKDNVFREQWLCGSYVNGVYRSRECKRAEAAYNQGVQDERARNEREAKRSGLFPMSAKKFTKEVIQGLEND